jgi:hypothetical protein
MKRFLAPALSLVLIAASAPPVTVETAGGDWSKLPLLNQVSSDHLSGGRMARLHDIVKRHQCQIGDYVGTRLDFGVSFAAKFDPDGTLRQIVIPKLNCPEAEGIVGGALLEMIQARDYRPTGANPDGWYRGNFSFAFES